MCNDTAGQLQRAMGMIRDDLWPHSSGTEAEFIDYQYRHASLTLSHCVRTMSLPRSTDISHRLKSTPTQSVNLLHGGTFCPDAANWNRFDLVKTTVRRTCHSSSALRRAWRPRAFLFSSISLHHCIASRACERSGAGPKSGGAERSVERAWQKTMERRSVEREVTERKRSGERGLQK